MKSFKLILVLIVLLSVGCGKPEANGSDRNLERSAHPTRGVMNSVGESDRSRAPALAIRNCLSYEPEIVELKGNVVTRIFYGPPNFGENRKTDAKERTPVLVLSESVKVCGDNDPKSNDGRPSFEGIRELQLVLKAPYGEFKGKVVIVRGTLFPANTGHHHTDVLMDVQSIETVGTE